MTPEVRDLYLMKGELSDLPEDDMLKVTALRNQIEEIIRADLSHGIMALALLIAEINAGRVENNQEAA